MESEHSFFYCSSDIACGETDRPSSTTVAAVYEGVNELESSIIPLLASPQGGVAERLRRFREASFDRKAGVVFRLTTIRKTTPAASASVAARNFLMTQPSPPCGDARRGIAPHDNSFTP